MIYTKKFQVYTISESSFEYNENFPKSVEKLNAKFEKLFAIEDSLTFHEWKEALPNENERKQMQFLISWILSLQNFDNFVMEFDAVKSQLNNLFKYIQLTFIQKDLCVIHEKLPPKNATKKRFARFWGYMIISSRKWSSKRKYALNIHHSAAHFQSDGRVSRQAAVLFEETRGRTLVVAGASRFAVKDHTKKSKCQPSNRVADAAHNNLTMFHSMLVGIQKATYSPNYPFENIFIQWHGMANNSCPNSTAFVSVGIRNDSMIYQLQELPANRLSKKANTILAKKHWKVNTPLLDSSCQLLGTTNIFGRFLNGVPKRNVCYQKAKKEDITGSFIHIEQKNNLIESLDIWSEILNKAFPLKTKKKLS